MRALTLGSICIGVLATLAAAQNSDRTIRDPYRKPGSSGVHRSEGSIHHSSGNAKTSKVKEPNVNNQLNQLEHRTAVIQGTKSHAAPANPVVKPKSAGSMAGTKPIDFSHRNSKTVTASRSGTSAKIPTRPRQ